MNSRVISVLAGVVLGIILSLATVLWLSASTAEEQEQSQQPAPPAPVFDAIDALDDADVGKVELIVMDPLVFNAGEPLAALR